MPCWTKTALQRSSTPSRLDGPSAQNFSRAQYNCPGWPRPVSP
jgi:hypothetical protein